MRMVPIPRPLAVVGDGVGGGFDAVGAAAAAAAAVGALAFRAPPRLPPLVGDPDAPTLTELIKDAWDGARLPVGFPSPPPLPDPGPLAGAVWGGLVNLLRGAWEWWLPPGVTAEDWAAVNWRPGVISPYPPEATIWPTGTWDPNGSNSWSWRIEGLWIHPWFPESRQQRVWVSNMQTFPGHVAWLRPPRVDEFFGNRVYLTSNIEISGPLSTNGGQGNFTFDSNNFLTSATITATVRPTSTSQPSEPFPTEPRSARPGFVPSASFPTSPAALPSAAPAPRPRPIELPALPAAPVEVPGELRPATAPAPARVPARAPAIQPLPAPAPASGVTITRGGTLPAAPAPRPTTTPAGTKVVTVGGAPAQVVPVSVPETLAGIAAEVGRIETKIALQLARPEPEAPDLSGLQEALQELLGQQGAVVPGAVYRVRPPCGRAADGGPLPPVEVPVPEAADVFAAILARLDALAALVDEQKQLRGPVCKGKPTGEPVTVTFLEVG